MHRRTESHWVSEVLRPQIQPAIYKPVYNFDLVQNLAPLTFPIRLYLLHYWFCLWFPWPSTSSLLIVSPLNSACCSHHNRDVIHCYLKFFLCGESKLSFSQAANSFLFPLHSPLYLLKLISGHIISIILLTFLQSVEPTWPFTEPRVYNGASQVRFSSCLRILTP